MTTCGGTTAIPSIKTVKHSRKLIGSDPDSRIRDDHFDTSTV